MKKEDVVSTIVQAIMDNPTIKKEDDFIICEVCGHSNAPDKAICDMCSNYLKRSEK